MSITYEFLSSFSNNDSQRLINVILAADLKIALLLSFSFTFTLETILILQLSTFNFLKNAKQF